jgi:hypothetical protein
VQRAFDVEAGPRGKNLLYPLSHTHPSSKAGHGITSVVPLPRPAYSSRQTFSITSSATRSAHDVSRTGRQPLHLSLLSKIAHSYSLDLHAIVVALCGSSAAVPSGHVLAVPQYINFNTRPTNRDPDSIKTHSFSLPRSFLARRTHIALYFELHFSQLFSDKVYEPHTAIETFHANRQTT